MRTRKFTLMTAERVSASLDGARSAPRTILVLVPFYLPAFKAGGCVRGVSNVVAALSGAFRFKVVCRDRDLGDAHPFPHIAPGQWNSVSPAEVYYVPPGIRGLISLFRLLREASFDAIYLNSFFSSCFTVWPLLLRRFGLTRRAPVLLTVRGELHDGALSIDKRQKTIYRTVARALGLYQGVTFHVFGPMERKDLSGWFLKRARRSKIVECSDLAEVSSSRARRQKEPGELRIVFLSRIIRNKNLAYALQLLQGISGRIEFDIYGPQEDGEYWEECEALMRVLPQNVTVRYCGVVEPTNGPAIFSRYHLFLFPSAGESFGYVILESVCAGCPVITSDRTPWQFENGCGGWVVPLSTPSVSSTIIQKLVGMDQGEYSDIETMTRRFCEKLQCEMRESGKKMEGILQKLLQSS